MMCDVSWQILNLLWAYVTFCDFVVYQMQAICDESMTFYDTRDPQWPILWHNFIRKSLGQWLHVTLPWHLWPSRDVWNQSENYIYVECSKSDELANSWMDILHRFWNLKSTKLKKLRKRRLKSKICFFH